MTYLKNLPQVPEYHTPRYAVGRADAGPDRGSWLVIRVYDASVCSKAFSNRRDADGYCAHLNHWALA